MNLRISDTEITSDTISNVAHKIGEGRVVVGGGDRVSSHNDAITTPALLGLYAEDQDLNDPLMRALETELGLHPLDP